MPQIFKTLSQLLDAKRPTLTADDLAAMATSVRSVLLDQEFLVPARPATHVACDACYDDHVEEVTRIKDGKGVASFRICCSEAGWVDVPENPLRQWTVNVRRLVTVLSTAVGSGQSPDELIRESAWRLGIIEIAGESYDVVFVRIGGPAHEPPLDELARKRLPARTIVVASRDLPEASNGFAAMLPLATAFMFTGGRVSFQLARVRSIPSAWAMIDGNVFRLQGEFWQLSFEGETVFLKDSVGLQHIAQLLANPGRYISAISLSACQTGVAEEIMVGPSEDVVDAETCTAYEQRCLELAEKLQIARRNNDLERIEKLEAELEQVADARTAVNGNGRLTGRSSGTLVGCGLRFPSGVSFGLLP